MDELSGVDLEIIKLINKDYNRRASTYISKETTDAFLLEVEVIMMSAHSPSNWYFINHIPFLLVL